uniref:Exocyst complex component Sec3 coiled-coil domain-containing protein n=1 Tax=Auxenochlorella protothecoides TaxID=3075 RepID=A0A1D2A267_AUXPR
MQKQTPIPREIHRLFVQTEDEVLACFQAQKCVPGSSSHAGQRGPPKPVSGERFLVLTYRKRSRLKGLKGTLQVCKLVQGSYQVRKAFRTKALSRMECFPGTGLVELSFSRHAFTSGEVKLAFRLSSDALRLEFLGILYDFCTKQEHCQPAMLGIQDLELRVFAANAGAPQAKATAGVDLPGVASQPAPRAAKPHIVQGRAGSVSRNPPREDRQLETLLALVAGAGGSLEEVTLQLTTELEALEDAGVHELLESEDQVLSLRQDLDATIGLLDDLEDNLSIFDAKMGLMRQDVAAIEVRNNQLETQSRNDGALLDTLDSLLSQLALGPDTEKILMHRQLSMSGVGAFVAAFDELSRRVVSLSSTSGALPGHLRAMTAIQRRGVELAALQRGALARAVAFVESELAAGHHKGVDLAGLHAHARQLRPLLALAARVSPADLDRLRRGYCAAITALLARSAREIAEAARSAAAQLTKTLSAALPATPVSQASVAPRGQSFAMPRRQENALLASQADPEARAAEPDAPVLETAFVTGLQKLLDTFIPLAQRELDVASEIFSCSEDGSDPGPADQGPRDLGEVLVSGPGQHILNLASEMQGPHALVGIPALAAVFAWQRRLTRSGQGKGEDEVASALLGLLERVEAQLTGAVDAANESSLAGMRRYVAQRSTSALSASAVKSTHVLPFLPRFLESVRRVEAALSQGGPGPRNSPGRGAGLATLSGVRGGPPRPSPFGAAPGAEPGAAAAGQAAALALARRGWATQLAGALAAVGEVAARDQKHGPRICLENYVLLQRTFQSRREGPLADVAQRVDTECHAAEAAYIEQQVDYFGFTPVLALSRKLDDLCNSQPSTRPPAPISLSDATSMFATSTNGLAKKLGALAQRLLKHFGSSSPELVPRIWQRLEAICLSRWERIPKQLRTWYPTFDLPLTVPQLKAQFLSTKPMQTKAAP